MKQSWNKYVVLNHESGQFRVTDREEAFSYLDHMDPVNIDWVLGEYGQADDGKYAIVKYDTGWRTYSASDLPFDSAERRNPNPILQVIKERIQLAIRNESLLKWKGEMTAERALEIARDVAEWHRMDPGTVSLDEYGNIDVSSLSLQY